MDTILTNLLHRDYNQYLFINVNPQNLRLYENELKIMQKKVLKVCSLCLILQRICEEHVSECTAYFLVSAFIHGCVIKQIPPTK